MGCLLVSVDDRAVKVDSLSKDAPFFVLSTLGHLGVDKASYLGSMTGNPVSESELGVKFNLHLELSVLHIGNPLLPPVPPVLFHLLLPFNLSLLEMRSDDKRVFKHRKVKLIEVIPRHFCCAIFWSVYN